jgi:hypothetical protein
MTREPADHDKVIEENPLPSGMGAGTILKRDKNFNWFLTARILSQFATMGFAFYIVYALRRFEMDASHGRLSHRHPDHRPDRRQCRHGLAGRPRRSSPDVDRRRGICHLQLPAGMVRPFTRLVLSHFHPLGFCQRFHLDERHDHDRRLQRRKGTPFYIGLAQTLTAPATIIAPLIGGWIADTKGFVITFGLSSSVVGCDDGDLDLSRQRTA